MYNYFAIFSENSEKNIVLLLLKFTWLPFVESNEQTSKQKNLSEIRETNEKQQHMRMLERNRTEWNETQQFIKGSFIALFVKRRMHELAIGRE